MSSPTYATSGRRGPPWWALSTLLAERRSGGVPRVLGAWLVVVALCVAGGVLNVKLGWNGVPVELGGLTVDFTFYPPLLLSFLLAIWLGPAFGAIALYAANLASSAASGMVLWKALLFSLAGPLEIAVLWGSMTLLGVSPRLPTLRDRAYYVGGAIIGCTAASLAAPIWNAGQGLDVVSGMRVWRGWVLGDLTMMLLAAPLLALFSARVGEWLRRAVPVAPRRSTPYGTFVALVSVVFVLLGTLMALGVYDLMTPILGARDLATASGELVVPRLREVGLFVGSLFLVLMTTTVLFTAALARRGRADRETALRDPLTGCLNRRFFEEMFEDRVRLLQPDAESSVALVDVDHFKVVNDRFGHTAGDQALRLLVARIRASLGERDALFRWGGEEFLVLLPGTPLSAAQPMMDELRRRVAEEPLFEVRGEPVRITVSVGLTRLHSDPVDMALLLQQADGALYEAKRSGRDRVVLAGVAREIAGAQSA
jgi:diguanylate cyclase (GGDEF)-like protein